MISRRGFTGGIVAAISGILTKLSPLTGRSQPSIICPHDLDAKCFYLAMFDIIEGGVYKRRTTAAFLDATHEEVAAIGQKIASRGFVISKRKTADIGVMTIDSPFSHSRFLDAIELRIDEFQGKVCND